MVHGTQEKQVATLGDATNKPSPLLNAEAAGLYLGGINPATLCGWRCRHFGPAFVKVGRLVRYRQSDLDNWLESQVQRGA